MLRTIDFLGAFVVLLVVVQERGVYSRFKGSHGAIVDSSAGSLATSFKLKSAGPSSGSSSASAPAGGSNTRQNQPNTRANQAKSKVSQDLDESDAQAQKLLNAKRADHGSLPLAFCPDTKALALECADSYQQFQESTGNTPTISKLGSCNNKALSDDVAVYFYTTTNKQLLSAYSAAINEWYDAETEDGSTYNYEHPDAATLDIFKEKTQMLWNNTKAFGSSCSESPLSNNNNMSTTPSGRGSRPQKMYVCCFAFVPGGNIRRRFGPEEMDDYKKNVRPPLNP